MFAFGSGSALTVYVKRSKEPYGNFIRVRLTDGGMRAYTYFLIVADNVFIHYNSK